MSDEKDIASIIIKRKKAKGKLKIDENKSRVGNKRIPKNVVAVSTENVALNSEEEEVKWRFMASMRIAAERMLSEVTKMNADIMGILEDAGVIPTVEIVDPYFPKLVREFICNMTYDIDEHENVYFQKATLRNYTIDFSPSLMNAYYGRANGGKTGAKLKLSQIAKVLTGAQQHDILIAADEEAQFSGFITISPKLLQGTHVANIPLRAIETGSRSGAGNEETARFLRDEIKYLDGVIQSSLAQKSVLDAHLRSMTGEDDPAVAPDASDSEAEASQE
ncbi:hypothetical protein LIER_42827 [Lithospermum erythrorhizon]|uniref:Uncharacterized protein n=1 Tax=Lithospermum erythrorhizon TaxID=34254 RepID=A0AAV3P249_LITER